MQVMVFMRRFPAFAGACHITMAPAATFPGRERPPPQKVIIEAVDDAATHPPFTRKVPVMDERTTDRSLHRGGAAAQREGNDRDSKRHEQNRRQSRLEDALERGLEDTFPASDPVSVVQPPSSVQDKNEMRRP
jgi:hypothetical protein